MQNMAENNHKLCVFYFCMYREKRKKRSRKKVRHKWGEVKMGVNTLNFLLLLNSSLT